MQPTKNWDKKYLNLAKFIATNWSKDPSTQVGAVLVNWESKQEFIGYNGFPVGVIDLPERYEDRETKLALVVHAEVNALLKAGPLARGGTLYVWPSFSLPPICSDCAKIAIQSGVKEVVGLEPDIDDPRFKRWAQSISVSKTMFEEAGITWRTIQL